MAYVDPAGVHNPSSGAVATAAWGDAVNSAINLLANPPRVSVYRSADYGIADSDGTEVLAWNAETYDTDTMHSLASNTGRLTATTAGRYLIVATIIWEADATGLRRCQLRLNGSSGDILDSDSDYAPGASNFSRVKLARVVELEVGDYVEVYCYQDSGGALSVIGSAAATDEQSHLEMTWVGV